MFEPVAITGRACVLPGANTVADLWQAVVDCRDLTTATPEGAWGTDLVRSTGLRTAGDPDVVACERGGYVSGFEALFDPTGFGLDAERIARLDPAVRWLLHCARQSLIEARVGESARRRTGLVLGNLSYPSRGLAEFACDTWLGLPRRDGIVEPAENRFVSGLPAQLAARALGLAGPAFALDAACASSLYAVKLACELLQDRSCDVVLAGGLNRADSLFLNVGFTTLSALSASGRSRPLTVKADGLLPAEGAALLALKRLDDAVAAGDRIFGVIRGAGLSNDGRERGLLAPDGKGQIRAMRQAYETSGVAPESIGFVECHATGTTVGDSEEIRSMAALFSGIGDLPIGALKANLGHLITASGAASILKVTAAFEAAQLPPTLDADEPLGLIASTPLRLLGRAESWRSKGPRRAGVNAFGFGGNNAHLVLEEPPAPRASVQVQAMPVQPLSDVAVVGVGVAVGDAPDLAAFVERLRGPAVLAADRQITNVVLPGKGLRFPPADLRRSLGQQTLALNVAFQALADVAPFDGMTCGVYFGMGCDPESARWALRWRLAELLAARGLTVDEAQLAQWREAAAPPLNATSVVGTMPNIPANRLSAQFDFRGPAFTVSAEELSGIEALRLARRALGRGEIDAALVGAVDLSCEPVHQRAASALLGAGQQAAADGAVALVLKRLDDAQRAGDHVLAVLPGGQGGEDAETSDGALRDAVRQRFGSAHAASGLLELLGTIVETMMRGEIDETGLRPTIAIPASRRRATRIEGFAGQGATVEIAAAPAPTSILRGREGARLYCYGGRDRAELVAALDRPAGAASAGQAQRLAIVARSRAELEARLDQCRAALAAGAVPAGPGIYFGEGPALGPVALVFAGANTYPAMGRDMFLAYPEIGDALAQRFPVAAEVAAKLYGPGGDAFAAQPFGALKAASLLCQAHAVVARQMLGVQPQAVLGLSSGETNSLFAFDIWRDMSEMFRAVEASGLYDVHLAGRFQAARSLWSLDDRATLTWQSWLVSAPLAEVTAALHGIERAAVSIVLSPGLSIVGGTGEACTVLLDRIGRQRAVQQTPTLICHSPVLEPFAADWAALHERETEPAPDLRFYSQAHNGAYALSRESVRDALLGQARNPIDFSATVERAWQDGVRVFIEAGPRNILSRAIGETLAGRPHLAVSLDNVARRPADHLAGVAARLFAAGVTLDHAALSSFFGDRPDPESAAQPRLALTLPARAPAFDAGELRRSLSAPTSAAEPPAGVTALAPARAVPPPPQDLHVFSPRREPRSAEVLTLVPRASAGAASAAEILPPPYDRRQLEALAEGRVSTVFGRRFRGQDGNLRQVRMPMPPLLLADRVVSVDAPAGELGRGRMVTETDIAADAWYLDEGRMPVGLLIEAGQADLLLVSWMGIDALNRGDRVYRLLGCEITFHDGGMPVVGDTLRFDIGIDSHAQVGDLRMFFFGYDCRVGDRLVSTVRHGQAGFFSDAELAAAKGVNWSPPEPLSQGRGELPASLRPSTRTAFSDADLAAFATGDALRCFGPGFEQTGAHQRTPRIGGGRMRMLDRVTRFEPTGGPRGLGYLEAAAHVPVDAWFYEGHFLNDPCMPGTLMADAAVQALAFHMAALGMTVNRDGWRFEPVAGEPFKFVCRGQVVPDRPHDLRYEVFVEEIVAGPTPTVYATLLCTCDGLKVFHCPRFGLRLVPDCPVTTRRQWLEGVEPPRTVRDDSDVRGDFEAVLACAWGKPSIPFGANYARFDREGRVPRLPGPPYLFVSRVLSVDAPPWQLEPGVSVVAEYDVPPDAWYFRDNDRPVMPFAVLSEVLLQPCGWLASYVGSAASGKAYFRNLDGSESVQHLEVTPDLGTLSVRATLTRVVRLGELTLTFFEVACHAGDRLVCRLKTSFGIFSAAELAKQAGLSVKPEVRALLSEPAPPDFVTPDLSPHGARLALPGGRLRMIDEVTGYWPATAQQPGRIRCRRAVSPYDWYFKAHFYEDPVQPGSLGLEALLQSLKAYLILGGHGDDLAAARFEPIALGEPLTWKYRGQITTDRKEVVTTLKVTVKETEGEVLAIADGILWADGLPIYEVSNLAVRVAGRPAALAHRIRDFTPAVPAWVADHCPTYTVPALPIMTLVPEIAAVARRASGRTVVAVENVRVRRWMPVPETGVRLVTEGRLEGDGCRVRVVACEGTEDRPLRATRQEMASGHVRLANSFPPAPPAWTAAGGLTAVDDPYASASLFHGPAFHLQTDLRRGPGAASAVVTVPSDPALSNEDRSTLLLDAFLHSVPHDEPELWLGERARGLVAFPEEIVRVGFYAPLPVSGRLVVETRLVPSSDDSGLLRVRTQVCDGASVVFEMEHVERLRPKGVLGRHAAVDRRRFLAERHFVPGIGLTRQQDGETSLTMADVHRSNWLPGTLESAYAARGPLADLTAAIAVKEHFARQHGVHPARIEVGDGDVSCALMPFRRFPFTLHRDGATVRVTSGGAGDLSPSLVSRGLGAKAGVRPSTASGLHAALVCETFSALDISPAAEAVLVRNSGATIQVPALEGPAGLAVATALAAVSGRGSDIAPAEEPHGQAISLSAVLAGYPLAGHEPLLRAATGAGGEGRHLLLTAGQDGETADHPPAHPPMLRLSWREGRHGRPVLEVRCVDEAAAPGIVASSPIFESRALWQAVLEAARRDSGFELATDRGWSREAAWLIALSAWADGLSGHVRRDERRRPGTA